MKFYGFTMITLLVAVVYDTIVVRLFFPVGGIFVMVFLKDFSIESDDHLRLYTITRTLLTVTTVLCIIMASQYTKRSSSDSSPQPTAQS